MPAAFAFAGVAFLPQRTTMLWRNGTYNGIMYMRLMSRAWQQGFSRRAGAGASSSGRAWLQRLPLSLPLLPLPLLLLLAAPRAVATDTLVVLVDTGTEMPMAAFRDNRLVDGAHRDLGLALAARLKRQAVFVGLPRKRIALALEQGKADLICLYVPAWLPGHFQWSRPFFPMTEVVVSDTTVPRPASLADLAGQRIATVLGYYHPELEQVLGRGFVREDGPSNASNLRKMAAGRLHHVVTQQLTLDYQQRMGERLAIYPPLPVKAYQAQCAVSERGQVGVAELNRAIAQIVKEGGIAHIVSNYQ